MRHETPGRRGKSRIVAPGLVSRFPGGAFAPPAKAGGYTPTGRARGTLPGPVRCVRTGDRRHPITGDEPEVASSTRRDVRTSSGRTDFMYLRVVGWGWYESAAEQALQRERERPGAHVVERIAVGQAGVLRVKRVNRVSAGVFDFVHDRISQLQAQ